MKKNIKMTIINYVFDFLIKSIFNLDVFFYEKKLCSFSINKHIF
jgi:hypothetical protein